MGRLPMTCHCISQKSISGYNIDVSSELVEAGGQTDLDNWVPKKKLQMKNFFLFLSYTEHGGSHCLY
jgi:hypothetical protein